MLVKSVVGLTLTSLVLSTSASGSNVVIEVPDYVKAKEIFAQPVLQGASLVEFQEILSQPGVRTEANFQRAFDVYLRARIAHYSPFQQQWIRVQMPLLSFNSKNRFTANGLHVDYPEQLRATITTYATMAHELEHVIQELEAGGLDDSDGSFMGKSFCRLERDSGMFLRILSPHYAYWAEFGAMLAEWEILGSTPKPVLYETLDALKSISRTKNKKHLAFARAQIESALTGINRVEHVEDQHRAGRYTFPFMVVRSAYRVTVTGSVAYLTATCAKMLLGL